jgi:hypothetical protein
VNKALAPLLTERRNAAKDALERLREMHPTLSFVSAAVYSAEDYWDHHTYTVRLHRGDPDVGIWPDLGLLRIADVCCTMSTDGRVVARSENQSLFCPSTRVYVHEEEWGDTPLDTKAPKGSLCNVLGQISTAQQRH